MQLTNHYITKSIRSFHSRHLLLPALYLVAAIVLWFVLPLYSLFWPAKVNYNLDIDRLQEEYSYVSVEIPDLYFTGYTSTMFGRTTGYYYYCMWDGKCVLVQLAPDSSEEGRPSIKNYLLQGKVVKGGDNYDRIEANLADDLEWSKEGLSQYMSGIMISELAYEGMVNVIFKLFYVITVSGMLVYFLTHLFYSLFPLFSPTCQTLGRFGNAKNLLHQAETELATLPQLATEDMFITETFFIEVSRFGVAIIPINEIVWIYKHSTLHKFLWYHFTISNTLHITGTRHFYLQCPKNIKSDIDGVMDYLAEANHNILVGFSEQNRMQVQRVLNYQVHSEKLIAFLRRRI